MPVVKVVERAMQELDEERIDFYNVSDAKREVQGANFGDKRLDSRYAVVFEKMVKMPQAPFNQSCESLSEMHAAYRFVSNEKVTTEKLLEPHRGQISRRGENEDVVLAIQDTTVFDVSDHSSLKGIRGSKPGNVGKALFVHPVFFILPNGLPLGIGDVQVYTGKAKSPDSPQSDDRRVRADRAMDEKESGRWLQSVNNCRGIFKGHTRVVWLSDRESDIYEVFEHIQGVKEEFVIRARVPRGTENAPHHDTERALAAAPVQHRFELKLNRTPKRKARVAQMELRFIPATIAVPETRERFVNNPNVVASVVEVRETNPNNDIKDPIEWKLVTNLPVHTVEDAQYIAKLYTQRWAIEELFKILKSGGRAEKAQFQTIERLKNYITLSLIAAWRIYYLVHVNRVEPNAPAECVVTKAEKETLQLLLNVEREKQNLRRINITTAHQVITQIAILGGHLQRSGDPAPGTVVIWRGIMALAVATMTNQARDFSDKNALM